MKLSDLHETASAGMTSVASIGQIEYAAFPNRVELYRRCTKSNTSSCVAKIQRKKGKGWSFVTTPNWKGQNLAHFGHLTNIKSPSNGMKTVSNDLPKMLKQWGIKVDDLKRKDK